MTIIRIRKAVTRLALFCLIAGLLVGSRPLGIATAPDADTAPVVVDAWEPNAFRDDAAGPAGGNRIYGIEIKPSDVYVPGQVLVRFDDDIGADDRDALIDGIGATVVRNVGRSGRLFLLQLAAGSEVQSAVTAVSSLAGVDAVEPNYLYYKTAIPDDPDFADYWALNNVQDTDIDAPEAWDQATGNHQVVIGVIDSGIDYDHIDLVDNVWTNPGEIAGNGIDDDGNGWIDDIHGIDTFNDDADPDDDDGHGTHVSGTIAATGNNGVGGVGVMWQARLIGCKFLGADGFGTSEGAIGCLDYFSDLDARGIEVAVTNNSWGGRERSQLLRDAIEEHNRRNILFVAAAGNDSINTDRQGHYPSAHDNTNIISVAAVAADGRPAYFTNYGLETVDIAAPGVRILSTLPNDSWRYAQGTSMASPHVAGVAGLLRANDPTMTMSEIRDHILTSGVADPALASRVATGSRLRIDLPILDDDRDGMPNWWEERYGLNPADPTDAGQDLDGDGLSNLDEYLARSDPTATDTDGDGLSDGDEVNVWGTDPLNVDSDEDGLNDREEVEDYGTDPGNVDTDGDGLRDFDEINIHGTNPTGIDTDNDGLSDAWELEHGFDPLRAGEETGDDDADGLSNAEEFATGTNPLDDDSDDDGLSDGEEPSLYGTDPLDADTDGDRMADGWEIQNGFAPLDPADGNRDADGDGFSNRVEFRRGTDPNDPLSFPSTDTWYSMQGNAAHTGHADFDTDVADFSLRSTIAIPNLSGDSTFHVAADLRFYSIRRDHPEYVLEAYDLALAERIWQYRFTDFPAPQALQLDGHDLLVPQQQSGPDGEVVSHDIDTGQPKSTFPVDTQAYRFAGTPLDGDLFYRDGDEIVARQIDTGEESWRTSLADPDRHSDSVVAVNDDYVVFHELATVQVFDRATGAPVFQRTIPDCRSASRPDLMLDDAGRAYLSIGNCVAMIDIDARDLVWTQAIPGYSQPRSAMNDTAMFVATHEAIYALNKDTGETLWSHSGDIRGDNLVVTRNHLFYTSSYDTKAIDLQTRQEVWSFNASGSLLLSDDGALLISSHWRELHVINIDGDDDGDGLPNWWERYYRLNPLDPADAANDDDGDGLANVDEFNSGTSPIDEDSDDDGLRDGDEINVHGTDPLVDDTDGDGLDDGDEIKLHGTDPSLADTDGDQISDGDEVNFFGTDPTDPASVPDLLRTYRESFEAGLPADWLVPPTAVAGWTVSNDDASHASYSLKSDPVQRGESAEIEWRQVFAQGELAFDARLGPQSCCDVLNVYIDDVLVLEVHHPDWERYIIPVSPGTHTIRFAYEKNWSVDTDENAAWIDNLVYYVPRPLATTPNHFLVLDRSGLREIDRRGEQVRLPIPLDGLYNRLDVVVTENRDIVVANSGSLYIVDAVSGAYETIVVDTWYSSGSGLTEVDGLLYSPNLWNPLGIAVIDLDGNHLDTLAPGQQYIDLYTGPSGDLWALRSDQETVDRISTDDGGIVQSLDLNNAAEAIAVDAAGNIFIAHVYPGRVAKYDQAGTPLASIEIAGRITDMDVGNDGRIVAIDMASIVWFMPADLSEVESFDVDTQTEETGRIEPVPFGGDDGDGDGIPDWWELINALDAADPADAALDPDADGLDNLAEYLAVTDPNNGDSDGDGLGDGEEVQSWFTDPNAADTDGDSLDDYDEVVMHATNPLSADTDADGLTDWEEIRIYLSDPNVSDTDGDGMPDGWEVDKGLDVNDPLDAGLDKDADGLTNREEFQAGTDIFNSDSDSDGLADGEEVKTYFTNPIYHDSDGDSLRDGWEVRYGFDPLADAESLDDADGDGYSNRVEFFAGSDPISAASIPQIGDWSTHQGNVRHTGFVPVELDPALFAELWTSRPFGDAATGLNQAAAAARLAFVSTANYFRYQALAAVDTQTGETRWLQDFGDINEAGAPAIADNRVYLQTGGHQDSFLRSFEADTGKLWLQTPFTAQWPTLFAPAPYEGDLFGYAGYTGGIASFSGATSTINWEAPLSHYDAWSPAVNENTVYAYSQTGLTAIDRLSGTVDYVIEDPNYYWSGYSSWSSPILDDWGNILVSQNSRLVYFDTTNRSIIWEKDVDWHWRQVTLADNVVYGVTGPGGSDVVALDLFTGAEIWRWTPPEPIQHSMVATIDHLIAANDTTTYVFNLRTLAIDWSIAKGGQLSVSPDGILLIATLSADLTAVRLFGDKDKDGMPDVWEKQYGFDPDDAGDGAGDADGDGVDNAGEYRFGTDPFSADSDGDGLSDGDEINTYRSNPRSSDTDDDGLTDAEEVQVHGSDPTDADSDDDGLDDFEEVTNYQTDPTQADTDNDGVGDLEEIRLQTDPNDAASVPQPLEFYEESFEDSLPPVEWYRPDGAHAGWILGTGSAPHGRQWLGSQPIGNNETAAIEFVGYFGDGVIAFESRVSAEHCCDTLRVSVDGNQVVQQYVGTWQRWQVPVTPGIRSIRFEYAKDEWGARAQDRAFIDRFTFYADDDLDAMPDTWETDNGLDPTTPNDVHGDPDGDGLDNRQEYDNGTLPQNRDTDADEMDDGWEVQHELDPLVDDADQDADADGASNLEEYRAGTRPRDPTSKPAPAPPPSQPSGGGGGAIGFPAVALLALLVLAATRRRCPETPRR